MSGLANHFRNILVAQSQESHHIFDFNKNLLESFINQGKLINQHFLVEKISVIENAIFKYNQVENKKMLVEITLMKISKSVDDGKKPAEEIQKKKVDLNIDKHKILKESTNNTNIQKEKKDDNKEPYQTDDIKKTVQNEISALSLSSIKLKKEVLNTKDKD